MSFGTRLRECREGLGWSQTELGRRTGITPEAISKLENNRSKNPSGDTLLRLAHALGVRPEWLDGRPQRATVQLPDIPPRDQRRLELIESLQIADPDGFLERLADLPAPTQIAAVRIIETLAAPPGLTTSPPTRRAIQPAFGEGPLNILGGKTPLAVTPDAPTRPVPVIGLGPPELED